MGYRSKIRSQLIFTVTAASQGNLEELKEIHYAVAKRQLELRSNHLESKFPKIKTSHDSKETDLEKCRQLYLKEIESKESLRNELNKTKETLAETNTELLLQKQQSRSSLSTFNPKPGDNL
ncbi:hypothetical protein HJG60_008012 [Phyllostomus discolor]|uniref:DUF3496 domain-containing protein n=1 Tax=Phyllostomus discolor TaxID=89673 RepID=A0A834BJZ1_9CHIR|nr:hypothetical protein HJG60_008012 [Phyllostomus discolor]